MHGSRSVILYLKRDKNITTATKKVSVEALLIYWKLAHSSVRGIQRVPRAGFRLLLPYKNVSCSTWRLFLLTQMSFTIAKTINQDCDRRRMGAEWRYLYTTKDLDEPTLMEIWEDIPWTWFGSSISSSHRYHFTGNHASPIVRKKTSFQSDP